jgi:O-antigen/teichoic acid export membrane protein
MLKILIKDIFIYGGSDFFFRAVGFVVLPVYTHAFTVADFGLMSMLGVAAGLTGMFANVGVNNAVQRFYWDPLTPEHQRPALVSTGLLQLIAIGLLVTLSLLALLYPLRAWMTDRYGIQWDLIVLVILTVLPDQVVQYALDAIRLHFTPVRFIVISFIKNGLGVAVGVWLIKIQNDGINGFFTGVLVASLLSVPFALWFIRRDLVFRFDRAIAKNIFSYGYPFVFTGLAYWIFGSMDRWLLAELGNSTEVGLYSIAFKFASIVTFVNGAFSLAWSPFVMKLKRDHLNYRQIFSNVFSIWFFVLAIVGFAISIFAFDILMITSPEEYWRASGSLSVVAMGVVFFGTTQITALGISLERKTALLTQGAVVTAFVNFALNILMIPAFGAMGSAFATLVSYLLLTCVFLYWTQRLHPIPLEKHKLGYSCFVVLLGLLFPLLPGSSKQGLAATELKLLLLALVVVGAFLVGIIRKRWFLSDTLSRIT